MDKVTLNKAVQACKETTKEALQTIYDALNRGQQKQILKNENVKALLDLYEVIYSE